MATNFYKVGGSYYTTTGQKILNLQQLQSYAQAGGREVSAPAVPQGATLLSGPSQLQGLTESQIFRQGQNIYRLPQVVSSNQFNQQQSNIQPVDTQNITPNITGLMAGVQTSNEGLQNIITEQQRALQSQDRKTEVDRQLEQYTQQVQGQQRELQEQKLGQYGAQQNLEQLQAIMPQIARIQADYNRIAEENLNRPISSRIIGGTADRIQRQKAVELAGLSAVAQAYQGNVEMARVMAQDAINAQYQDQTNYFNALNTQLYSIEADLSREEKVKFEQLKTVIADRGRLIKEEKENATAIQSLALDAVQKGATQEIVSQIVKANNLSKAIEILSKAGLYTESGIPQRIGSDADGNDLFYDPVTKSAMTAAQLIGTELGDKGIVSPSGNAYDMSTYATDPKHAQSVQNIINQIGKFNSVSDIDNYIKSVSPNSPITGDMIAKSSAQYGIGWEELVALIQHESGLGTSNVSKNNNNFGGITWNANFPASMKGTARPSAEGGNYVRFATVQDGVNSIAYELSKRKVELTETIDSTAESYARLIQSGQLKLENVPTEDRQATAQLLATMANPKDTANDIIAKEKAQLALDLKTNAGLSSAVGPVGLARVAMPWQIAAKQDFIAGVEQLVSGLSLEALIQAKSQGATFGALSDSEMRILASSATRIGTWALRDETGKVKGYKASQASFKKELDNINKILLRGITSNLENNSDPLGIGIQSANSTNPLGI